jgi:hypothetical protein
MLGALVVIGLAANGRTLLQSVVAVGFVGGVLLMAWLWQVTLRGTETAPRLTRREKIWNAAVFVAWLAVMAALGLLWYAGVFDEPGGRKGGSQARSPEHRHS